MFCRAFTHSQPTGDEKKAHGRRTELCRKLHKLYRKQLRIRFHWDFSPEFRLLLMHRSRAQNSLGILAGTPRAQNFSVLALVSNTNTHAACVLVRGSSTGRTGSSCGERASCNDQDSYSPD
jgi:hypothetical protein